MSSYTAVPDPAMPPRAKVVAKKPARKTAKKTGTAPAKRAPVKRAAKMTTQKKIHTVAQTVRSQLRTGEKAAKAISLGIGAKNDNVSTPEQLIRDIEHALGTKFNCDPCPAKAKFDCLAEAWPKGCNAFVNPPYSRIPEFLDAALRARDERGATVALLVPVRSDSRYWEHKVFPEADSILFINGRVCFDGYKGVGKLPIPLCVIVYRPSGKRTKTRTSDFVKGKQYSFVRVFPPSK